MSMLTATDVAKELQRLIDERGGGNQIEAVYEEIPARVRFTVKANGETFDFSVAQNDMPAMMSYISERYLQKVARRIAGL